MNHLVALFDKIKGYISLTNIGTFLATVTPISYLSGLSYYQGCLSAVGVEADTFPLSTQYIYINAYFALTNILFNCLSFIISLLKGLNHHSLFILFCTIAIASTVHWCSKLDAEHPVTRWGRHLFALVAHYRNHESAKPLLVILSTLSSFYFLLYFLAAVTFCLWMPSYAAYSAGQKSMRKRIQYYTEHGCIADRRTQVNNCTVIKDEHGEIIYKGLLVASNDRHIAIFDQEGSHVFTRKEGFLLERTLH